MINEFNSMIDYFRLNGFSHTVMECVPGETYRVHTLTNNQGMVLLYEHEGELLYFDYVRTK